MYVYIYIYFHVFIYIYIYICVAIIQISTKILAIILDLMHHLETTPGLYELESVQLRQPHEAFWGTTGELGWFTIRIFWVQTASLFWCIMCWWKMLKDNGLPWYFDIFWLIITKTFPVCMVIDYAAMTNDMTHGTAQGISAMLGHLKTGLNGTFGTCNLLLLCPSFVFVVLSRVFQSFPKVCSLQLPFSFRLVAAFVSSPVDFKAFLSSKEVGP